MVDATFAPVNRITDYFSCDYDKVDAEHINSFVENALPRFQFFSNNGSSSVQKTSFRLEDWFDNLIPKSNSEKIVESRKMRNQVSVIQALTNFKLSLYSKSFSISSAKQGSKLFINTAKKWNLKKIQKELHDDLLTSDNAVLVWKANGPRSKKIQFVMRLPTEQVKLIEVNQQEFLYVMLDKKTFEEYETIIRQKELHDPLLIDEIKKLPKEWFEYARLGKPLPLSKKDGYHFSVKRKYAGKEDNGLCAPSMMSIFTDALIIRYLELAEFTTAFNLKNLILHIRHGETVSEAGIVNRQFRTNRKKLSALRLKMNNLEKGMRFYTDHTVQLDYVFPPLELFKKERYESVFFRVINIWGGMPNALFAGDSKTSVGSAFVSMKRPQIEGDANREIISEMITEFLAFAENKDESKVPTINYDNDALRDDRVKLDIFKFLKQFGGMDYETIQRAFGFDPDQILAGQKRDQKHKKIMLPTFEPSQGIVAQIQWGINKGGKDSSRSILEEGRDKGTEDAPAGNEGLTGEQDRNVR